MKVFGERLKELRTENNLTTRQLADQLKISSSAIVRWENDSRIANIDALYKIAVYFKVSADYLIGLED